MSNISKEDMIDYLSTNKIQSAVEKSLNAVCNIAPQNPFGYLGQRMRDCAPPAKPNVIFVLGGPGSGKGTQCANIVRKYGYVHLSAGDLLRAEKARPESKEGALIAEHIQNGTIVPIEITLTLINRAMKANMARGRRDFLIDGFPRNKDNLDGWNVHMKSKVNFQFLLFFECSEEVMTERLMGRGRGDDNASTVPKRFVTFREQTMPVVESLQATEMSYVVNAEGTPDAVWEQTQVVFARELEDAPTTTYAMIKPDVVREGKAQQVLDKIWANGFEIVEQRNVSFNTNLVNRFYAAHVKKSFFPGLAKFMTSGGAIGLVLRKTNAWQDWRKLCGATDSKKAEAGTIRAQFGTDNRENAVHGSDSLDSANREMEIVFPGTLWKNTVTRKLIISGPPAAGKGTQCELLKKKYGVVHLSTGDMLRAAVKAGSPVGKEADEFMSAGKLVPDATIIKLVLERLDQEDCKTRGWLLDGFPRTAAQAEALQDADVVPGNFIILDVADETLIERSVGRRLDPETGDIYHLKFKPPTDPTVEARLTQRKDDTEEAMKVRIETYKKNVGAVIEFYRETLVKGDGMGTPDELFESIVAQLD